MNTAARLVVFAIGNRSRGDDAAGPLLLDRLAATVPGDVRLEECYQLAPEHVDDAAAGAEVLFVDASHRFSDGFRFTDITPLADHSFTTHALSPGALLALFEHVYRRPAPRARLLEIGAEGFELGAGVSSRCAANLEAAWPELRALAGAGHA
ncbi:MAG: hydrogenase maturation protease [Gammaproteobacteria bacterium]|nr:hydrogenase maturation protease [Gammaproteobacteria bacterium]